MSVTPPRMTAAEVAKVLRVPGPQDDKYTRGVVQLATGSDTYPGAAVLGVEGALGSGPGMVRFSGARQSERMVLDKFPEVVLNTGRFECVVIGSGWDEGRLPLAEDLIAASSTQSETVAPVVVDAGALEHAPRWSSTGTPLILTPHLGEARRLWNQLQKGRPRAETVPVGAKMATYLAKTVGAVVVLKSSTTWVADPKGLHSAFESHCGWAATAGSGDVLAGVIGGIVAANYRAGAILTDVVGAGVWIHAKAAEQAAGIGQPIRATQIAAHIPNIIGRLLHSGSSDIPSAR